MKTFAKIAAFVTLPIAAMIVLSLVAQSSMSAPTAVSAIADSGERWYNPISWALDESAQHAKMTADNALRLGVSYTQMMFLVGSMVSGVGLTLLVMAIRQGWVSKAEIKAKFIEQAPAATSTPAQNPPKVPAPKVPAYNTDSDSLRSTSGENRDPALVGIARATATA